MKINFTFPLIEAIIKLHEEDGIEEAFILSGDKRIDVWKNGRFVLKEADIINEDGLLLIKLKGEKILTYELEKIKE